MSNWLLCIERDPAVRARTRQAVLKQLPPFGSLEVRHEDVEGGFVAWTGGPGIPVDCWRDTGGFCLVLGLPHDAGRPVGASDLHELLRDPDAGLADGYFTAVSVRPDAARVAADLLGMAPVYYWSGSTSLLVGSSAHLFRCHPRFRASIDARGMADVLVTMQPLEGRTIMEGVRRLAQGCVLAADGQDVAPREVRAYTIPLGEDYCDLPFDAHVEILTATMRETVRCLPARSVLLSGGLDSRVIAGFAAAGRELAALSLGLRTDDDARLGRQVARALGLRSVLHEIPLAEYNSCAQLAARWEHLQNGFSNVYEWGLFDALRRLGGPMLNGLVLDALVGGTYLRWAYDAHARTSSVERLWRRLTRFGLPLADLDRAARTPELRQALGAVRPSVQHTLESRNARVTQQIWLYHLTHRMRTHNARVAWVTSFGAWPQMPLLDRRLLAVAGNLPPASTSDRRLEEAVLMRAFPALAEIPLDGNALSTRTLAPRLRHLAASHARRRLASLLRRDLFRAGRVETRRYVRTFDINNEGWRAIRAQAERSRDRLAQWFDPVALERLWPPPGATIRTDDLVVSTAGLKSLLGVALLLEDGEGASAVAPLATPAGV